MRMRMASWWNILQSVVNWYCTHLLTINSPTFLFVLLVVLRKEDGVVQNSMVCSIVQRRIKLLCRTPLIRESKCSLLIPFTHPHGGGVEHPKTRFICIPTYTSNHQPQGRQIKQMGWFWAMYVARAAWINQPIYYQSRSNEPLQHYWDRFN